MAKSSCLLVPGEYVERNQNRFGCRGAGANTGPSFLPTAPGQPPPGGGTSPGTGGLGREVPGRPQSQVYTDPLTPPNPCPFNVGRETSYRGLSVHEEQRFNRNICYYHQDQHERPLHPGFPQRLRRNRPAPSYSAGDAVSPCRLGIGSLIKRHPFSGPLHSAGKLLRTS